MWEVEDGRSVRQDDKLCNPYPVPLRTTSKFYFGLFPVRLGRRFTSVQFLLESEVPLPTTNRLLGVFPTYMRSGTNLDPMYLIRTGRLSLGPKRNVPEFSGPVTRTRPLSSNLVPLPHTFHPSSIFRSQDGTEMVSTRRRSEDTLSQRDDLYCRLKLSQTF